MRGVKRKHQTRYSPGHAPGVSPALLASGTAPAVIMAALFVGVTVGIVAPPAGAAPQPEKNQAEQAQTEMRESAFREGLRQRGLNEWLEQYLADTPAVSPVDEHLRRREALLAQAAAGGISRRQRQRIVADASRILLTLLANHPDHPGRASWRLELARDRLEREDPAAFDAVLLYELPSRDRTTVSRLSGEAAAVLRTLRAEVAGEWKAFESMDEHQMARAAAAGATRPLELLDGQSAFLMAWTDFYRAISADVPAPERNNQLKELVETITERYGWTAPVPGREVQRCSALAMAAVALRLQGSFAEADRAARTIMEIIPNIRETTARQGLRRTVLLAVLEQVRGPRDAGKLDEAAAIVEEAKGWAAKALPGDREAELAIALAERSLLARRLGGARPQTEPAAAGDPRDAGKATAPQKAPASLLTPAEALLPLQRLAAVSPATRDAMYEVLAGVFEQEALAEAQSPFGLQLVAGATLTDAVSAAAIAGTQPARDSRGPQIAATLAGMIAAPPAPIAAQTRGELLFLLARAHYLGGATLDAVRVLGDLAEQHPGHDRADAAARQGAAIAQEALRGGGGRDPAAARAAFVRAGRILRKRSPDSPAIRQLQFFIAAALDESRQFEEAAEEYAAVPADDPHALQAAWARARCLRDALNAAAASRPAGDVASAAPGNQTPSENPGERPAPQQSLAARAVAAARAAVEKAAATTQPDAGLSADITLVLAGLLNHPSIAQYEETVKALSGFETRHADCPAALAPALRERVTALRQLKRMGEARAAMEAYLAADPQNAGPLMARLLDAMRDEILAAADRGDAAAMKATADEAARLAGRLLAWATTHPGRLGPAETLTVSVWQAWATQEAGQAPEALQLYQAAAKAGPEALPADSILRVEIALGQAECLLAMDRTGEALPMFNQILTRVPEQSPHWWRAYVGTLGCHTRLRNQPEQILQSIRQQRRLFPELGGLRWARELKRIEDENAGH